MFLQVCVYNQKQKTSVEELCKEDSSCDQSNLARKSVFTNPLGKLNNVALQDQVDPYNHK